MSSLKDIVAMAGEHGKRNNKPTQLPRSMDTVTAARYLVKLKLEGKADSLAPVKPLSPEEIREVRGIQEPQEVEKKKTVTLNCSPYFDMPSDADPGAGFAGLTLQLGALTTLSGNVTNFHSKKIGQDGEVQLRRTQSLFSNYGVEDSVEPELLEGEAVTIHRLLRSESARNQATVGDYRRMESVAVQKEVSRRRVVQGMIQDEVAKAVHGQLAPHLHAHVSSRMTQAETFEAINALMRGGSPYKHVKGSSPRKREPKPRTDEKAGENSYKPTRKQLEEQKRMEMYDTRRREHDPFKYQRVSHKPHRTYRSSLAVDVPVVDASKPLAAGRAAMGARGGKK